jgi:hypothetical protein
MISKIPGRASALTMMLAFKRLLARASSRLPRVSYRIRQRIQPVQHLQPRSVPASRIAAPGRTRPLNTLALVATVCLPTVAGFAVWSFGRGDQPFPNGTLANSPAHSLRTSSPPSELKTVPNEPRPASSFLPPPRLVPVEPITTASISASMPIPMTAVAPLRPAPQREPVYSREPATTIPEPAAKAPELRSPLAPPAAHSSPALSSAEVAAYLSKAEMAMRNGDVVGARSLFSPLARAGDPRGAVGMARTYDEAEFKKLGVYGLKPDREEAERWRARARELTSAAARH